jgi:hypothetical protein
MLLATHAGDTFVILAPPPEGTADDDRFSERRIGVDHLEFGVDDRATLDQLADWLRAEGVETAGVETAGVETAGVELDPSSTRTTSRSEIPTSCSGSSTCAGDRERWHHALTPPRISSWPVHGAGRMSPRARGSARRAASS